MQRNETKRLRVKGFYALLGTDHRNADCVELWLVQEASHDNWTLLTKGDGTPCGLYQAYSLIGSLCSTRALDVEDGMLLVNGQRLKAEQYLQLWRKAPDCTAAEMAAQGFTYHWTTHRPSAAMRAELEREGPSDEYTARRRQLLTHPDMTDDGRVMSWRLDLFTAQGMQAYESLRWIYLCLSDDTDLVVPQVTMEITHHQTTTVNQPASRPSAETQAGLGYEPGTQLTFSL